MKNEKLLFLTLGIIAGGGAVWFLANMPGSTSDRLISGRAASNQIMMQSRQIDAHFIEQMIPHHEDAITMSKIALTKAKIPEVKTLAKNIIASQSEEIEKMAGWYKEWFGRDLPTGESVMSQHGMMGNAGMHMGVRGDAADISKLENSEDFDREFVEEMIPHHQMAVMMASMLKNGTQREEMRKLADDIITTQTSEIDMMRDWIKDWDK